MAIPFFVSRTSGWTSSGSNTGFKGCGGNWALVGINRATITANIGYADAGWIDDITFDFNDTLTDIVMPLGNDTVVTTLDRNQIFFLEKNLGTVTFSLATPCVATLVAHGLNTGDMVSISTTGALYTGLSATITRSTNGLKGYFINKQSNDTFWLYNTKAQAIAGGATGRINTSGSQSGTHTLWGDQRTITLTPNQIKGNTDTNYLGVYVYNWALSSPIAVTTSASTWRLGMYMNNTSGTATTSFGFMTNGTSGTPNYVFSWIGVGSSVISPTWGTDFIVVRGLLDIDSSITTKSYLGSNLAHAFAGCVLPADTQTFGNDVMVRCVSPATSYSITSDGGFLWTPGAGFQLGTSGSPISYANQFSIINNLASVGTTTATGFFKTPPIYGSYRGASIYIYGEIPTYPYATLAVAQPAYNSVTFAGSNKVTDATNPSWYANNVLVCFGTTGSLPTGLTAGTLYMMKNKSVNTCDIYDKTGVTQITYTGSGSGSHYMSKAIVVNESTGWSVNQKFSIGLQDDAKSTGDNYIYTIGDITADGKSFSCVVVGRQQYYNSTNAVGGKVINADYRGVKVTGNSAGIQCFTPGNHCYISGITNDTVGTFALNIDTTAQEVATKPIFIDSVCNLAQVSIIPATSTIPMQGFQMNRILGIAARPVWAITNNNLVRNGVTIQSGTLEIYNSTFLHDYLCNYSTVGTGLVVKWDIQNVECQSSIYSWTLSGVGTTVSNLKIWGNNGTTNGTDTPGAVPLKNLINATITNLYIDWNTATIPYIVVSGGFNIINTRIITPQFDTLKAGSPTNILAFSPSSYVNNMTIENPNKTVTVDTSNQSAMVSGSQISINTPVGVTTTYYGYRMNSIINRDNTTFKNSPYTTRFDTDQVGTTNYNPITFVAQSGVHYYLKGNLRYNTAYTSGGAGTYTLPSISVTDGTITPVSFTCAGSAADTWQPFILDIIQSSGIPTIMKITATGQSNTATGSFWVDGVVNYPYCSSSRFYGYVFDDGALTKTIDTFNVLTEANALALSSAMSYNTGTNTLTVTGSANLSNIYDYMKATASQTANLSMTNPISTPDGINYNGTFNLVLGAASSITGTGSLTIGAYTLTVNAGATSTPQINSNAASYTAINVTGLVAGSRIQLYNVTDATELYNGIVAGTSYSLPISWTTNKSIRMRAMYVNGVNAYQMFESTGTLLQTGLAFNASQLVNSIYNTNAIDGSTVTECSISGTTIRIYVDQPSNATTWQRIYNWYESYLFTAAGIKDQVSGNFYAIDSTTYKCANTMAIINQDTVNPLAITGGNCSPESGAITSIVDTSNGASIVILSDRVVDASGKLANLDIKVSAVRNAIYPLY